MIPPKGYDTWKEVLDDYLIQFPNDDSGVMKLRDGSEFVKDVTLEYIKANCYDELVANPIRTETISLTEQQSGRVDPLSTMATADLWAFRELLFSKTYFFDKEQVEQREGLKKINDELDKRIKQIFG